MAAGNAVVHHIGGMHHSPWCILAKHAILSKCGNSVHLSCNYMPFYGDTVLPVYHKMHSFEICAAFHGFEIAKKAVKWYRQWRLLLALAEVIFYHGTYERFSNWARYHHYFVLSATRDTKISVLGLVNMVVYMDWVVVSHSQPFLAQLGLNPSDAPDPAADLKAFESAFHLLDQSMDDNERVLANSLLTGLSSYIHCGTCPQLARSWNSELSAELRARSSHQDYVCTEVKGAGNWFRYCIGMLMLAVYHMCVPIHLSFLGLAKLRQGQRERVVRTNHAISHVLSRRSWWHCIYVLLYFSVGLAPWCVLYTVTTGWSNGKMMGEGEL